LCFEAMSLAFINHGRQGMLAAPTFAMLRDAAQRSLAELFDEQDVEYELKKADGEVTLKAAGSVILLRSLASIILAPQLGS